MNNKNQIFLSEIDKIAIYISSKKNLSGHEFHIDSKYPQTTLSI